MTKVCARDRTGALSNLEDSLRRLRTDVIDLWQFHEINYANDDELVFAVDGAAEAAQKALADGKVRYVGCTGHKDPAYLLAMLGHEFPMGFGADAGHGDGPALQELHSQRAAGGRAARGRRDRHESARRTRPVSHQGGPVRGRMPALRPVATDRDAGVRHDLHRHRGPQQRPGTRLHADERGRTGSAAAPRAPDGSRWPPGVVQVDAGLRQPPASPSARLPGHPTSSRCMAGDTRSA